MVLGIFMSGIGNIYEQVLGIFMSGIGNIYEWYWEYL